MLPSKQGSPQQHACTQLLWPGALLPTLTGWFLSSGAPRVSRTWCLLFLWFYNPAHSWTMAWTLIVLLNPNRDSFPLFSFAISLPDMTVQRNPVISGSLSWLLSSLLFPLPYSFATLAQCICFLSLDFYVLHFFSKLKSLALIHEGPYGYLLKRMKKIKTRQKEHSQGLEQPPVTPGYWIRKRWGWPNTVF